MIDDDIFCMLDLFNRQHVQLENHIGSLLSSLMSASLLPIDRCRDVQVHASFNF